MQTTDKEYSVTHTCGYELSHNTLAEAKRDAKQHKIECEQKAWVAVDEYSTTEGQLTGNFWKI